MRLTDDKLLLEKDSEKTAGGLFLPELNITAGYGLGKVVASGPGRLNPHTGEYVPNSAKVGDRVLFNTGVAPVVKIKKKNENGEYVTKNYYLISGIEAAVILDDDETI